MYSPKKNSNIAKQDFSTTDSEEYASRLQALKDEFARNKVNNDKLLQDSSGVFDFIRPDPSRHKRTKKVDQGLRNHKRKTQKFNRKTGEAISSLPVHEDIKGWADAALHGDEDVLNRFIGTPSVQDYLPQQLVVERDRPLDLNRLYNIAFSEACLGIQKDILIDEKVSVGGGNVVGFHYIVVATILYDLLLALKNEITIFSEVTPFYNYVRSFLTPRKIGQYSYDWINVPEMEDILSVGIPFRLPERGFDTVSVAWPTGTFNAIGQADLANVLPVLTVDMLHDHGIPAVTKLWKRIMQQSEGDMDLIEPYEHRRAMSSAAAFAIPRDIGTIDYNGYLTIMSEVSIPESQYFMSSLRLVDRTDPSVADVRGKFMYRTYSGSSIFNWRLMNQDCSTRTYIPKPRQVSLSAYLLQVLSILVQADIEDKNVNTSGAVVQPTDSFFSNLTAGDFLVSVISFVLKRYAMSNFLMLGTDSVNEGVFKLGVGMNYIIDYGGVINGLLPLFVTEGMASLNLKPVKVAERKYELMIPYIVMTGKKTHADPLSNNDLGDPDSVLPILQELYTFVDPQMSSYAFALGTGGNQLKVFDIGDRNTAFLYGSTINDAILSFNVTMGRIQGNADIGVALGNIHTEPYTLADYSYFCSMFDVTTDWDDSADTRVKSLTSVIPIDPNFLSDQLTRILPMMWGDSNEAYIAMTGETVSLKMDIDFSKQIVTSAATNVHQVAGIGTETGIADRSIVARGGGGGVMDFLKKAGKVAVPVLSLLLGQLGDAYAPGSGAIIRQLGSSVTGLIDHPPPHSNFVKTIMKNSYKRPYSAILRPLSAVSEHPTRYHVTQKPCYF